MSNHSNVIELNGSQYDALTGAIIAPPVRQSPYQNASQPAQQTQQQQSQYNSYGGNHTYDEQRLYTHSTQPGASYSQPQTAPAFTPPAQQTQTQPLPTQQVQQPQYQQTQATQQLQPAQQPQQAQVVQQQQQVEQASTATAAAPVSVIPAEHLSAAPVLPTIPHVPVATPTTKPSITRKAAQHAKRHKPQSTRTLMRHAVKAPTTTHQSHNTHSTSTSTSTIKARSAPTHHKPDVLVGTHASRTHHITAKTAAHHAQAHTQAARHQRAQAIIQSDMIDRFRKQPLPRETTASTLAAASPLLPVAAKQTVADRVTTPKAFANTAIPAQQTQQAQQLDTSNRPKGQTKQLQDQNQQEEQRLWPSADRYRADSPDDQDFDDDLSTDAPIGFGTQPLAKTSAFESGVFEPRAIAATAQTTQATQQTTQASKQPQTTKLNSTQGLKLDTKPAEPVSKFAKAPVQEDIFERALAVASSHQQQDPSQPKLQAAKRTKKPRRVMRWAASAGVLLVIMGIVALQNRSAIQMQLASAKAGFTASAPGYKPSGFAMAKISYSPGTVSANYEHNEKSFTVIQKKTTWDSQALLDNFVATSNEAYQGYDSKGRTIYVYGSGRATWVNNGVWYQLHADNVLSNEQLVKIAASM